VIDTLKQAVDVDVYESTDVMPRPALLARMADKDAVLTCITDRVDDEFLDASPRLKVIANFGVGYNHIDVPAARRRGVIVANTPDVLTDATAELTWAMILDAARRVSEGDRLIRRSGWTGWRPDFLLGTELRGKQLGIVGFGRIGQAVAEKAAAFGLSVAYSGRPGSKAAAVSFPARQDFISIHTPLTVETTHLFDKRAFARMKRTAFVINTSRGPLIDEAALAWALNERLIAGAALDVFEQEPQVYPALLGFDNVVLVPHLGSATRETRTAMADLAARNIIAVLGGQPPLTPVP
jgi:lactate dehydrogenase-like 2-hydroxyacid dehydrogenase